MTFDTVFDVAQDGYRAWWLPALMLTVAALAVLSRREGGKQLAALLVVLGGFTFATTYATFLHLRHVLLSGEAEMVEGRVVDFRAGGLWRHKQESFSVADVRLSYATFQLGGGFHQVSALGGPIHAGERVRVWHVGPTILKLQIAKT